MIKVCLVHRHRKPFALLPVCLQKAMNGLLNRPEVLLYRHRGKHLQGRRMPSLEGG